METQITLTVTRSLLALRDSFKVLAETTRLVALVANLFGIDAFDVAKEFETYFMDLEPGAFEDLKKGGKGKPQVYFVGPLIRSISDHGADESECLRWLDKQPNGSVLYVSFGSGRTLSNQQLNELALGLEMSGQRFLWVVKSPHETAANASYFSVQSIKTL
ncbi:hydroquinone glucosyltransferase [Quercus suber]|uniref:Hydroquinone glucosyltransferase n=1 Tax=Quercus suber TaxID=58331 RepID=A0AAW0L0Z2_QUESU